MYVKIQHKRSQEKKSKYLFFPLKQCPEKNTSVLKYISRVDDARFTKEEKEPPLRKN